MSEILRALIIYIPISIIGIWRWTYWLLRISTAQLYRPNKDAWPKSISKPTITIVTPVYNEDPEIFELAMQSWIKNDVNEIIAVIDKTNTRHIVDFERRYSKHPTVKCRALVTPKPGKRAALCDGIAAAKGDLIALVDSDTIWNDHVVEKTLPHFLNKDIGGSTAQQRIYKPNKAHDILFDLLLWTRYKEEVPFLLSLGKVINTLSGRTAFYRREAIFNNKYDNMHDLRHEFFFGTRGISGDDKRLTHIIIEQGWHIAYVKEAIVYTPGLDSMRKFMKQRLRWTRNSWRADLRAVKKGWVFRHPALALFMTDRFIQPFIMMLGPVACAIAIIAQDWFAVSILITWWVFSRFVRTFGYFRMNPKRLRYLPIYILYTYVNALVKIYALATIVEHSWATRWDKKRLQKGKRLFRRSLPVVVGTTAVLLFLTLPYSFVSSLHTQSAVNLPVPDKVSSSEFVVFNDMSTGPKEPALPESYRSSSDVRVYTIQQNDTLSDLSDRFQMTVQEIKKLNGLRDPDELEVGKTLIYYKPNELSGNSNE